MGTLAHFKSITDRVVQKLASGALQFVQSSPRENLHYANIASALYRDGVTKKIAYRDLFKIYDELIYGRVLYGEPVDPYLPILDVIRDASKRENSLLSSLDENELWDEIVLNALSFNNEHSLFHVDDQKLYSKSQRGYDRAIAAKALINHGCKISIEESDLVVKDGLDAVLREIRSQMSQMGSRKFIGSLLQMLVDAKRYRSDLKMFFLTRTATSMGEPKPWDAPVGYLLNLSVRDFSEKRRTCHDPHGTLKKIIDLATILAKVMYNVEPYSIWETEFHSDESLIEFLRELALYDSIYTIGQESPASALETTREIISHLDQSKVQEIIGVPSKQLIGVMQSIIDDVGDRVGPADILVGTICRMNASQSKADALTALEVLSKIPEEINGDFEDPADYTKVNFGFAPLIKMGENRFLQADKSWCAPAYLQGLIDRLRTGHYPNLDEEIGAALEAFVKDKLLSKGIASFGGRYYGEEVDGECDLVVETSSTILIFEFKKKPLTRRSRAGSDIDIFIDLSDSLLSSQLQAGRSEILIRKNGKLALEDKGGQLKTIVLGDRRVERISLTLQEYGALHDRTIIRQFFEALLRMNIGTYSEDDRIRVKFEQLRKKSVELRQQHEQLLQLSPSYKHFPFFNCWFLSLPQLKLLIENSIGADSFSRELMTIAGFTYKTLDFYAEYTSIKGLGKYQAKGGTNDSSGIV